jgi:hypothetical protein
MQNSSTCFVMLSPLFCSDFMPLAAIIGDRSAVFNAARQPASHRLRFCR